MAPRNYYTLPEIVFCTYIARFGRSQFNETDIKDFSGRSLSSIKMKVQNIASMIDEAGYKASNQVRLLTGKTTGEKGRKTNWDDVHSLLNLSQTDLLNKCSELGIKAR
ncbi:TPA: hypothetical protein ACN310_004500 [Vibrio parahaemolyticus]|uniref:hypothetical protein n=1 Tax=Vibrio parahaemolyticus TaxID=670 RepID=UPI00084B9544|nr:hypothetical protein [Vibrio parahaemolyticus]EHW0655809.1 hypothetical protein [Vibrio parahaemolyticus]EJE4701659.1 hypothetical protein [Vibrio parahaemolyticus]EKB1953086.1 hypothetical protein [Vibrio parahaemolyticus]ELA9558560.1 hypothetical protein [Vibrio parahaemolyticus]MDK9426418.1 hypothetical protein [Vibrio parahaemolyticus]